MLDRDRVIWAAQQYANANAAPRTNPVAYPVANALESCAFQRGAHDDTVTRQHAFLHSSECLLIREQPGDSRAGLLQAFHEMGAADEIEGFVQTAEELAYQPAAY